jgi:Fur family ferric uptake transcriptional regulator
VALSQKTTGMRMTRQRKVILEELCRINDHPSADELHQRLRRKLGRISLATVYRNLELLSSQGLIGKLEQSGSQKRFDGDTQPHYHFRCLGCDLVQDVPGWPVQGIDDIIKILNGYQITGHRLELVGFCPECRSKKNTSGEKQ